MTCVGIDLGTTNSLVAVFDENGPRLLPNALGEMLTPSVVGVADDGRTMLIGKAARMRMARHPDLTAARFKRLMGTTKKVSLGGREYTPVELSAMVLKSLKTDAEAALGEPVSEAVISVPAYFNGLQRQATKDAAEIAGLKVRRLINEPTAAALAAGVLDREAESTFVVLDLGGGTFDVSILEMFDGVMEVRASSGDAWLGGEDFTARIAQHLAQKADMSWSALSAPDREKMVVLADDIKRRLSTAEESHVQTSIAGREVTLSLTPDEFNDATADLLARLRRPIEASLYDSGIDIDDIDRVILVGGATRMAAVRAMAARIFRQLPDRAGDPDHAIALGAAVQAGLVARHEGLKDVVMTDVSPFSLGIEVANEINGKFLENRFQPLIERNTILPASRSDSFATVQNNQTRIKVKILQGESAIASENIMLGEIAVNVPRGERGKESIDVRFTYDVSGLLAVDVKVHSTGQNYSDVIDNLAAAMSEAEKAKRLKMMEALKIDPRDQAENVALMETLKHLHEMLLGEDREYLQQLIHTFQAALTTQDPRLIAAERDKLHDIARQIEENYVI
ncbi:Hsp70 family protein [Paracoccus aurantiacus]|uniref:Hsp70 family protein n=1 Tax=Paracoccus aurantiacus TaxID=2599412 RepID=A0A5C6RXW7_9RHOB|nr:Hsp70 family protein [Paracoccus aurantiacus]TXB66470.1 Hsp70 family protein [Paracoccus aurantiacus]